MPSDPPLHVALGPDLRRPSVRLFKVIPPLSLSLSLSHTHTHTHTHTHLPLLPWLHCPGTVTLASGKYTLSQLQWQITLRTSSCMHSAQGTGIPGAQHFYPSSLALALFNWPLYPVKQVLLGYPVEQVLLGSRAVAAWINHDQSGLT